MDMLEIHYLKNGSKEIATVESPERFLASQYLEVPPFQDHYPVEEVFLDGKRITLRERTISGLFNYLNTK
ncbi:hypothetical protein EY693_15985 [Enterococcus casseliflavus]|nr:hypothetical protein [Enterococcus casseliflavus]MBE9900191.1 hypothetical protein [Enterococcus casseliflavus]MBE9903477.1 hypothetical protein [Enterococcus casseliflavus]MBE9923772.1 hypothetical protein [Enterococcus casseliflavus]MBO6359777.1 hypothetical protein [Enterococcus casseliflavus]